MGGACCYPQNQKDDLDMRHVRDKKGDKKSKKDLKEEKVVNVIRAQPSSK